MASVKSKAKNSAQTAYLHLWFSLIQLLERKSEAVSVLRKDRTEAANFDSEEHAGREQDLSSLRLQIRQTEKLIEAKKKEAGDYPLEKVSKEHRLTKKEKLILLILLRDSLGFSDNFIGYEGKKIIAIISDNENDTIANRSLLYKNGKLRSRKLILIEKNWSGQNILDAEYFLSEKTIRQLLGHHWEEEESVLEEDWAEEDEDGRILMTVQPRFQFDDVILAPAQKQHIQIALGQQVHRELIFDKWGFGKKIPYGNALTMLFSGPPGTGKTMMAEAIAHYLGKTLLIAHYAQIQNLYVGETEKRIVAAFHKAQEADGVLLWDEADAMFYSRNVANASWECRDINVILQEIERFGGVVILTTNRKVALDNALERRISLKVDFGLPDATARELIWKSLMPPEAPLAADVNFTKLAAKYEIAGGTIKNAILHAARYVAYHQANTITMADFLRGIEMEMTGGWDPNKGRIGF